jgi:hypothetical protein
VVHGPVGQLVAPCVTLTAVPRTAGRTLRSMELPEDVVDDITWNNCYRFLGIEPPSF